MVTKYKDYDMLRKVHADYTDASLTLAEVSDKWYYDASKLSKAWKNMGLHVKNTSDYRTTRPVNDFFHTIDSEIKAYLLGFFASDGHIEHRKAGKWESYSLKWDIHAKDVELLHLINHHIGNNTYNVYKCKDREIVGIAITSKQVGEDLKALGYDRHKTRTCKSLPTIDPIWMPHFLRGYFDGDGSVSYGRAKQGFNRDLTFACFSKEVIDQIHSLLPYEYTPIISYKEGYILGSSKKSSSWTLSYKSMHDIRLIRDYLYKDANFFLKRKKAKFDMVVLNSEDLRAAIAAKEAVVGVEMAETTEDEVIQDKPVVLSAKNRQVCLFTEAPTK
jgi:hypothetical protein